MDEEIESHIKRIEEQKLMELDEYRKRDPLTKNNLQNLEDPSINKLKENLNIPSKEKERLQNEKIKISEYLAKHVKKYF